MSDLNDLFGYIQDQFDVNPDVFDINMPVNENPVRESSQCPSQPSTNTNAIKDEMSAEEFNNWDDANLYPKIEDLFQVADDFLKFEDINWHTDFENNTKPLQDDNFCPFDGLLSPNHQLESGILTDRPNMCNFTNVDGKPQVFDNVNNNYPAVMNGDLFPSLISNTPQAPFNETMDSSGAVQNDASNDHQEVQSLKLPLEETEKVQPEISNPQINSNKVKYISKKRQISSRNNVVRFSTHPALKKSARHVLPRSHKARRCYNRKHNEVEDERDSDSMKVVLPVGVSGCQIAIPSKIPIHLESFLFDKAPETKTQLESSDTCEQTVNQSIPKPVFKLTEHGCVVQNYTTTASNMYTTPPRRTRVLPWTDRKFEATSPKIYLSPQFNNRNEKLQILNYVASKNHNPPIKQDYPTTIRKNMEKITSHLRQNIPDLDSDLLNSLSIPVSIVRRGYLVNSELEHIMKQVFLLKKLRSHRTHMCFSTHCLTCLEMDRYRSKLTDLKKWKHFSEQLVGKGAGSSVTKILDLDFSNLNKNFANASDSTKQPHKYPLKFQVDKFNKVHVSGIESLPVLRLGTNTKIKDVHKESVSSSKGGSLFNIRQLDVGKLSTVSDSNHNAIILFFLESSFFYEIELQNEYSMVDGQDYKVFYMSIEVPFSSLCRLQTPFDFQMELVIRVVPVLQVIVKKCNKRIILSEDKITVSNEQRSLISSMRTQLSSSLLHKLHLTKSNFKLVKNSFRNACHWLDITKNPFKSYDPLVNRTCALPHPKTESLYAIKTLKDGALNCHEPKKRSTEEPPEENNIILINIFNSDSNIKKDSK